MMLFLRPAWIEPTVTTAISRGSTSRETTVCRRMTVAAAITIGSIVACGREPWPPRPWRVTVRPSLAAIWVPERTPIRPAGMGVRCWPSTMSGRGKRSSTPSAIIACEPAPYSSAGWKTATTVPDHWSFVVAAYGLTALVLGLYWRRLVWKERTLGDLARTRAEQGRAAAERSAEIAERSRRPSRSGHPRSKPDAPPSVP